MDYGYLTRRALLGRGTVGLLGSVGLAGLAAGRESSELVVSAPGGGSASYEFAVSGSVEPLDSPAGDNTDGSRAWGSVYGWSDGYGYTGEVTSFDADGDVTVTVDGETVDPATLGADADRHRLVVDNGGFDEPVSYEFAVSGSVDPLDSPAGDDTDGSRAWGSVHGWSDGYGYTGEVTSFAHEGPLRLYVDGAEVDPATLGRSDGTGEGGESDPESGTEWRTLVVSTGDSADSASYEFTATDGVEPLDSPAGDNTDGSRAWGTVHGWSDGYRFRGTVASFSHEGPVRVAVDGATVDPATLGGDPGAGRDAATTSARTRGTPLHDTDDWSGWASAAPTTEVTADRSDVYRGSASLRLDVDGGRPGARYEPSSTLDLTGRRLSLALDWAEPERAARLFVSLVDADGGRSEFVAAAPPGMTGAGGGWVRCPVAKRLGAADGADLSAVASIRLSAWPMESGTIRVDDVRVHDLPDRGRVAFTFDDSGQSRRRAIDAMNRRGVAGTLFPMTHTVGEWGQLTVSDLTDAQAAGWAVGSHPQHADSLAEMSAAEAASAMDADRRWLADHGFDDRLLAWPFGSFDADALAAADDRYDLAFGTVGSPAGAEISTPMNVGRLNGNVPDADGDGIPDDPKRAIDRAAEFGELLVLSYHDVGVGGEYSVPLDLFEATVDHAVAADVDVVTAADLLD